jgi:hypothetical protein
MTTQFTLKLLRPDLLLVHSSGSGSERQWRLPDIQIAAAMKADVKE